MKRIVIVAVLAGLASAPWAMAQEATKEDVKARIQAERTGVDQDWPKKEEPALRVYKNIGHGLYAFLWHPVRALADGNEKFPGLGSVEIFRGVRRGSVELMSRTAMGAMGAKPRDHRYYSKPNIIIDSDPFLYHASEALTAGLIAAGVSNAETGLVFGLSAKRAQIVTDSQPFLPKEADDDQRASIRDEGRVAQAQQRYIGNRATINRKDDGTGNLLKMAKRR